MKTFEFWKRFSRTRVHEQRRHAETAQSNEAGNGIGCSCERRKLFTAVVLSTQRIAASDSNPFIQRAILFDLKECRSRGSSPGAFRIWWYGKFRRRESRKSFSILARKLSLMVRRVRSMTIGVTWSASSFPHTNTNQLARLIFRSLPQQNSSDHKKKDAKVRLALPSGIPVGV